MDIPKDPQIAQSLTCKYCEGYPISHIMMSLFLHITDKIGKGDDEMLHQVFRTEFTETCKLHLNHFKTAFSLKMSFKQK